MQNSPIEETRETSLRSHIKYIYYKHPPEIATGNFPNFRSPDAESTHRRKTEGGARNGYGKGVLDSDGGKWVGSMERGSGLIWHLGE